MRVEALEVAAPAAEAKPRWHVVVSKPHAEKWAQENLVNQGFEVYLPLAVGAAIRKGRVVTVVRPLFPGYLFVRFDPERKTHWRRIFSTRGVDKMFMAGDRPAPMPDRDIQRIVEQEEGGLIKLGVQEEQMACRFQRGDAVKVSVGNWADLEAVFLEPVDRKRAAVLVTLLGRESRQTVTLLSLK